MSGILIATDDPVVAVLLNVSGAGYYRLRETGDGVADVLDGAGNVIGWASRYPYETRGWAVHTRASAGFVPNEQVLVEAAP